MKESFDLISFGEIMLRLSPPDNERLTRGENLEKRAGGSELNVSSGAALLGLRTGIISKLPNNAMGTFIKNRTRFMGVSDDYLLYDEDPDARLGVYYYENGAAPRKPGIVYDRKGASINKIRMDEIPEEVFSNTRMFHTSGISLGLSPTMEAMTATLIRAFKQRGASISFDVNYRANLWDEDHARQAITAILPYVDVLFISEETSRRMFGRTGEMEDIQKGFATEFGCKLVCTTQRKVNSPKNHDFGSIIYDAVADRYYTEAPYRNIDVVDRIGSGDAYVSGVLFGLLKYGDTMKAVQFGDATSAVKNTIPGDLPSSDFEEIHRIIAQHNATGPVSEMNR